MDLTNIIKRPVISEKASELNQRLGKLVLEVHIDANKPLVREALEKLFDVKVKSVRILKRKGKLRVLRNRRTVKSADSKRAIVTLKEGYSIEALSQYGQAPSASEKTPVKKRAEEKKK